MYTADPHLEGCDVSVETKTSKDMSQKSLQTPTDFICSFFLPITFLHLVIEY